MLADCLHMEIVHTLSVCLGRVRRQVGFGGSPQQIDLNITVPFIFSARLYPYGVLKGDAEFSKNAGVQPIVLKHDITFFDRSFSTLYVRMSAPFTPSPSLCFT